MDRRRDCSQEVRLRNGDLVMVRTKLLGDRTGIFRLRVIGLSKYDGKRARSYAVAAQNTDQTAGIDAARKKNAYRHVAHQLHAYRLVEHFENAGLKFVTTFLGDNLRAHQFPVLRLAHLPSVPSQIVAWRKRVHTFYQRVRIIERTKSQIAHQARRVDAVRNKAGSEQGPHLGGKHEVTIGRIVVERLDAHWVARHEQALALRIPNGEGKHSAKLVKAVLAPESVGFENHFRVGEAIQMNSLAFELCADLAKVVNLAVVDDPIPAGRIVHG